jgi:hypothetical protein
MKEKWKPNPAAHLKELMRYLDSIKGSEKERSKNGKKNL